MTAPLCHGVAGGCAVVRHGMIVHSHDCPVSQVRSETFAPPPKRTMGQCPHAAALKANPNAHLPCGMTYHQPDCPALYPLPPQSGDTKDALTRLVRSIRAMGAHGLSESSLRHLETEALDLISEAREEQRTKVAAATAEATAFAEAHTTSAMADFSAISRALARSEPLPECRSAGGIVIVEDLSKVKADLLTTQQRMGEARQQALDEGRVQGHLDASLWLGAHNKGILRPTAEDMRCALAEMMDDLRGHA